MSKGITRRHRGHVIHLTDETRGGTTAIHYTITSDSGQGAAVGSMGWLYQCSLTWAARECERIIDNAIAGDEAKLAEFEHCEQSLLIEAADVKRPLCTCCKSPIDPDTCHCGEAMDAHNFGSGHSPVPMGCTCHLMSTDERAVS